LPWIIDLGHVIYFFGSGSLLCHNSKSFLK
jgi:hypothetical protein